MTAGLLRRCLGCGQLVRTQPCHTCERERDAQRSRTRGSASARGYGLAHQRARGQLVPLALGTPCPGCGATMTDPRRMDLHHSDPAARLRGEPGDTVVCSTCNRSWGNRPNVTQRDGFLDQDQQETPECLAEPISQPGSPSVTPLGFA
jgi:hypothetical protein